MGLVLPQERRGHPLCSSVITVGEGGRAPGWLGAGRAEDPVPRPGTPSFPPPPPSGTCIHRESALVSTWEQRAAFMGEKVPLPSAGAQVNKQLCSAPDPEAVRGRTLRLSLGSHVPEAGGGEAGGARWPVLELERTSSGLLRPEQRRECAPEPARPRTGRGALPRTGRPLRARFSAASGCGEGPAHHIPSRTWIRSAPAFNTTLVPINGLHCRRARPRPGLGSVPWPAARTGGPGRIHLLPWRREASPKSCPRPP